MEDLTITEAKDYLRASKTWTYQNARLIGGVKIGRTWRFTKESLDHFKKYGYGPGREHLTKTEDNEGEEIEWRGISTKTKNPTTGFTQSRASDQSRYEKALGQLAGN